MTITSSTAAYRSPAQLQRPNTAQAQKDNGQIASAQRARDTTAQQKAVAALRQDAPSPRAERTERAERDNDRDDARVQAQAAQRQTQQARSRIGSALNARA